MHTGYYFGFFIASLANYVITPLHLNIMGMDVPGWRSCSSSADCPR